MIAARSSGTHGKAQHAQLDLLLKLHHKHAAGGDPNARVETSVHCVGQRVLLLVRSCQQTNAQERRLEKAAVKGVQDERVHVEDVSRPHFCPTPLGRHRHSIRHGGQLPLPVPIGRPDMRPCCCIELPRGQAPIAKRCHRHQSRRCKRLPHKPAAQRARGVSLTRLVANANLLIGIQPRQRGLGVGSGRVAQVLGRREEQQVLRRKA